MSKKKFRFRFYAFRESPIFRYSVYAMAFCIVMLGLILIYINQRNNRAYVFHQKGGFLYDDQPCYATMEIPKRSDGHMNYWEQGDGTWGSQYDIYLYNNSSSMLEDYYIEMTVPKEARIDSSWNGTYMQGNGKIRIDPHGGLDTEVIQPKKNVKFGFVLYTNQLMGYSDFDIYCHFKIKPIDSVVFDVFLALLGVSFILHMSAFFSYLSIRKEKRELATQTEAVMKLCANFIDTRDKYTKMHSVHVAEYSRKIAKGLKLSEEDQRNIYYCGMMHDIGKVLIPTEILCKPGKLTDSEWEEMKKHTIYGAGVIQDFDAIPHLKDAILYHHERYDGKGYMSGLIGEAIPLVARIICVADSFDAMATNRSYRPHLQKDQIISELKRCSGVQFDPRIAGIMISLVESGEIKIED